MMMHNSVEWLAKHLRHTGHSAKRWITRFLLDSLSKLRDQMNIYDEECKKSPTRVLWRTYVKKIDILLKFIASHRTGNWERVCLSLITCYRLLLLMVPQLHLFAATVPKGNEQPEEHSTICIPVLHERSLCCAKILVH